MEQPRENAGIVNILLPEGVVSPTPYDDAYRTMLNDIPRLVIPLINELFETDYNDSEPVVALANELFILNGDGERIKRITEASDTEI